MINKKRVGRCLFFAFYSRKIAVSRYWVKNRKLLWYNSVDAITLAGTAFCRSNREEWNPSIACEAYRQSTKNLKSYMQRQWSLVGGMAGMFRNIFLMHSSTLFLAIYCFYG